MHDAPALTIDPALDKKAQAYAEHLAKIGKMVHDPTNRKNLLGENLAHGSNAITKVSVRGWYNEITSFNFKNPGFSMKTGHFTQLVWKNTKKAGFGVAIESKGVFVVCKYSPPGNVDGQYKENVLPKKK